MSPLTAFLVLFSVSFTALAQILLRKAMLVMSPAPAFSEPIRLALALVTNGYLWGGMICFGLSVGVWLIVLSRLPVSMAYPMSAIGYVLAAVMAVVFLGEPVGIMRIAGILLICCGVFVVARSA